MRAEAATVGFMPQDLQGSRNLSGAVWLAERGMDAERSRDSRKAIARAALMSLHPQTPISGYPSNKYPLSP